MLFQISDIITELHKRVEPPHQVQRINTIDFFASKSSMYLVIGTTHRRTREPSTHSAALCVSIHTAEQSVLL